MLKLKHKEVKFNGYERKKEKRVIRVDERLYYNKGLSAKTLAIRFGKSERTIYRWLKREHQVKTPSNRKARKRYRRSKKYPLEIFNRIVELKREIPQRSAPMIYKILREEFKTFYPSLSTIQKHIRDQGLVYNYKDRNQEYKRFQRQNPNNL